MNERIESVVNKVKDVDNETWAKGARVTAGIGTAYVAVKLFGPEAMHIYEERKGLLSLAAVTVGTGFAFSGKEFRTVHLGNKDYEAPKRLVRGLGIAAMVAGSIVGVKTISDAHSGGNYVGAAAGDQADLLTGQPAGNCAITPDFSITSVDNKRLQYVLLANGNYGSDATLSEVDGIFKSASVTALKDFQTKNGIAADGVFGQVTCSLLQEFVDNDDNTPSFDSMTSLRFPGNTLG